MNTFSWAASDTCLPSALMPSALLTGPRVAGLTNAPNPSTRPVQPWPRTRLSQMLEHAHNSSAGSFPFDHFSPIPARALARLTSVFLLSVAWGTHTAEHSRASLSKEVKSTSTRYANIQISKHWINSMCWKSTPRLPAVQPWRKSLHLSGLQLPPLRDNVNNCPSSYQ